MQFEQHANAALTNPGLEDLRPPGRRGWGHGGSMRKAFWFALSVAILMFGCEGDNRNYGGAGGEGGSSAAGCVFGSSNFGKCKFAK